MTQWVDEQTGGRDRGPVAIGRAWVTVLTQPRRFFRTAVAPGDQAPGLVFAAAVVAIASVTYVALVPDAYPVVSGRPVASGLLWVALLVVLVTPATLHLVSALQTLLLRPFVPDRAGVSETVQIIGYATAPCVLAGVPSPALRLLCCGYGVVLFVVGIATVHGVSVPKAALLAAVPASIVFGYGFGGFAAADAVVSVLVGSDIVTVGVNATGGDVNATISV